MFHFTFLQHFFLVLLLLCYSFQVIGIPVLHPLEFEDEEFCACSNSPALIENCSDNSCHQKDHHHHHHHSPHCGLCSFLWSVALGLFFPHFQQNLARLQKSHWVLSRSKRINPDYEWMRSRAPPV